VEIAEGDHGDAVSHEGVVGVVPFGALGVHPDAGFGDEIGDFGQHGGEDLLEEGHMVDLSIFGGQQGAVGPQGVAAASDGGIPLVVKADG